MTDPTLWRDPDHVLHIDRTTGPDSAVVSLLSRVEWGTSGPRYRMHHLDALVRAMPDTDWLRLWHRDVLVGCYGMAPRQLRVGEQAVAAHHRVLLAVDREHAGRGWGRELVGLARRVYLDEAASPALLYGYIETDNARSMRLSEQTGYRSAGRFTCRLFSARVPRASARLRRARATDDIPQRLEACWRGHAFADQVVPSLVPERLHVLDDGAGVPVAALQVQPERWTITSLPGVGGGLLLRLLPLLRTVLPAVQGHELSYLRLSHLWAADGQEDALGTLLGAIMAETGHHAAVHFGDPTSPTTARLRGALPPGLLGRLGIEPDAHVMAGVSGLDLTHWRDQPLWISPRDPA